MAFLPAFFTRSALQNKAPKPLYPLDGPCALLLPTRHAPLLVADQDKTIGTDSLLASS
ncbi:hypothetical protein AtDm6_1834 [Acetobacter tropicalis]|uniref:Uncharacterized protein n=2 Tax=Acetobacter tropicalis TaxID=104102 RepID=F7VIF6_9PROT|nr:hypothetical protein AtDm6_1834 [Acetobacter tropicalis]GAA10151.1 hypothetical protein ATPR_3155 [Acetobacter tropicalis NBRC 101654]